MFEKMRKGNQMVVAAMNMQQKTLAFPVPLIGFGKTSTGRRPTTPNMEKAQRQMMETIRQRQIELQKKLEGLNSPKPERRRLARRSRLSRRRGKLFPHTLKERRPKPTPRSQNSQSALSAIPTPTPHRTETKKSEADQAEGGGFGDGC